MRPEPIFAGAMDIPMVAAPTPSSSIDEIGPHAVWHSPVPYLFGGLAAMLGMIVLALLVLACSYWRLSGYLDSVANPNRDQQNSDSRNDEDHKSSTMVESSIEHVMVIMAGDEKPTFLATHASNKDETTQNNNSNGDDEESDRSRESRGHELEES